MSWSRWEIGGRGELPHPTQGSSFPTSQRWDHRPLKLSGIPLSGDGEEGERGLGVRNGPGPGLHLMGGNVKLWMPVEAKPSFGIFHDGCPTGVDLVCEQ